MQQKRLKQKGQSCHLLSPGVYQPDTLWKMTFLLLFRGERQEQVSHLSAPPKLYPDTTKSIPPATVGPAEALVAPCAAI
jgi:hypothetical protein